jgi:hypothetical protein
VYFVLYVFVLYFVLYLYFWRRPPVTRDRCDGRKRDGASCLGCTLGTWLCSMSNSIICHVSCYRFVSQHTYIQRLLNQLEFSCSRSQICISDTEFYCSIILQQNTAPAPFTLQSLHIAKPRARWRRRAILLPVGGWPGFGRG